MGADCVPLWPQVQNSTANGILSAGKQCKSSRAQKREARPESAAFCGALEMNWPPLGYCRSRLRKAALGETSNPYRISKANTTTTHISKVSESVTS